MSKISELIVRITGDTRGLDQKIRGAKQSVTSLTTSLSRLAGALGLTFGAAGLIAATKSIVFARAEMQALERGMMAVSESASDAGQQLVRLREVAKLPGLGLQDAVRGSINLQAVGFSALKSTEILRTFGNALATVGRGREDLGELIRQLGQLASRGKVTADNLKPIIERVPQVASILKREFGTIDTEALQELGISSEKLINTLLRELGKLPPVMGGIKNDLENFGDNWDRVLNGVGRMVEPFVGVVLGGFAKITESIADSLDNLEELNQLFKEVEAQRREFTFGSGSLPIGSASSAKELAFQMRELRFATDDASKGATLNARQFSMLTGIYTTNKDALDGLRGSTVLGANILDYIKQKAEGTAPASKAAADGIDSIAAAATKARPKMVSLIDAIEEVNKKFRDREAAREFERSFFEMADNVKRGIKTLIDPPNIEDFGKQVLDVAGYFEILSDEMMNAASLAGAMQFPGAPGVVLPTAPVSDPAKDYLDTFNAQQWEKASRAAQRSGRIQSEAMQQVSLVVNDTARNMAKLIFKGGKFKDVMKNAASEIAQAFTRVLIQRALKPLIDGLDTAIAKSNILSKIFGGGGGGGTPGVPSPNVPGTPGLSSTVSSGAAGWINAVGSIATAVSSIFGNFQQAAMNRTLDIIAKHTLQTANQLIYGLQPQVNQYLPALSGIHDRLMEIRQFGVGVYAQPGYAAISGSGNFSFVVQGNVYGGPAGLDQLFNEFVSRLKAKGFKL